MWAERRSEPSAWTRRIPVVVLAVCGAVVSMYLASFQYGLIDSVWDPTFGGGSRAVLTSALSRALPVHDAALGAAAYLAEAVLESCGGTRRWRERPWLVLLVGLTAAAMALTSIGLVVLQAVVVRQFCLLCLVSAAISIVVPTLVGPEVLAAARATGQARRTGARWVDALRGRASGPHAAVSDPYRSDGASAGVVNSGATSVSD